MDKPWLHGDDWPRTVRSNAKKSVAITWLFTGVWNLASWPAVTVLPAELAAGNQAALGLLVFPAFGLLLVWWAVKITREWRRFGVTQLRLDPYPGAIGGHVGGKIDLSDAHVDCSIPVQITLECVRSYVSGSGKNRSRKKEVRWQARGNAVVNPRRSGAILEFRFDVPADLPESEPTGGNYHFWQLKVSSPQPEVALDRTFEIGVFPTAEKSRHIDVDTSASSRARAREVLTGAFDRADGADDLRERFGLSVERQGEWLRLFLHRGRHKGIAAVALLVGAVFTGVMLFLPDEGLNTTIIRLVLGLCGIGSLLLSAYLPCNTLDVRISRHEIRRIRTWFGAVVRRQQIATRELEELRIERGGSMNSGDKTTIYYLLVGKGRFGKFRLLDSMTDRSLVEAVRQQVMVAAGLRRSATD